MDNDSEKLQAEIVSYAQLRQMKWPVFWCNHGYSYLTPQRLARHYLIISASGDQCTGTVDVFYHWAYT